VSTVAAAQRGSYRSLTIVAACLVIFAAAVIADIGVLYLAPLVTVSMLAVTAPKSVFTWPSLVGGLIVVILLLPIRRYAMPGNLPFELEPYRVLVAALGAVWIASLLVEKDLRLRSSPFDGPIALLVAGALGSVVVNGDRIATPEVSATVLKKLTFLLSYLIVFYLIVSVVRRLDEVEVIVKVLVVGGAIVAAFALLEARTGTNVFNNLGGIVPFLRLTEIPEAADLARGGRTRVYASAQHPIALGALLVMLLPFAISLARSGRRRIWWICGGLLALGALATLSRTGILMLLVIGLTYLVLRPASLKRFWPALLPAIVVVHLILPGTIGTFQESFFPSEGLIAQQTDAEVGSGRVASLGPALDQASQTPILGQGYGTRIVDGPAPTAFILDDQWLSTLLETGLVGVAAWLWLFVRIGRQLGGAAKRDDSERGWLLVAVVASSVSFAVGMLTFDAFSFIQATFMLFIVAALGASLLAAEPQGPASRVDAS
jgi:polysaccharide biosynthesis protein PslJ